MIGIPIFKNLSMKANSITPLTWKSLLITFSLVLVAVLSRIWPLHSLQSTLAWLTFYPAVMIISIYGGLWSGLLATLFACLFVTSFWHFFVAAPFIETNADWLGFAVFVFTGTMISSVSEAMLRAKRKALEAQLQAQRANQAKSAFLANMSHELRTPLNAILGFSQLLQRDKQLTSEHRGYLNTINKSGEHLLTLINQILEISKIEAKQTVVDVGNFDIHSLISDLKKMFQLRTDAKGLSFQISGVENLPKFVISDETKLRVILINLIGNSVKFTERGSLLVDFSFHKTSPDDQLLLVHVKDTGPGIAEEEQDKLFQYFVQTESGKKEKSGTGLGLAISQDYAKMLGGEITVESIPGEGSTFQVKIKIQEGTQVIQDEQHQRRVVGLQSGQPPRVLVAEDTDESRLLLVTLLRAIGIDVREAVDGIEAVEIFEQWKPHFIWMDIRMPKMDGLEATRLIKATDQGKQTVIVALSAHVLPTERDEIFAAGCDDFLGKPFRENALFEIMEKHLGLKYEYEENEPDEQEWIASLPINLDLSSLDDDQLADLKKALDNTDAMEIAEIAEHIKSKEPEIGQALQTCANSYEYDLIRDALNTSRMKKS